MIWHNAYCWRPSALTLSKAPWARRNMAIQVLKDGRIEPAEGPPPGRFRIRAPFLAAVSGPTPRDIQAGELVARCGKFLIVVGLFVEGQLREINQWMQWEQMKARASAVVEGESRGQ
jgi:hypothetical protein